jgi:hypothetical protein
VQAYGAGTKISYYLGTAASSSSVYYLDTMQVQRPRRELVQVWIKSLDRLEQLSDLSVAALARGDESELARLDDLFALTCDSIERLQVSMRESGE